MTKNYMQSFSRYFVVLLAAVIFIHSGSAVHASSPLGTASNNTVQTASTTRDATNQKVNRANQTLPVAIFTIPFSFKAFGNDISISKNIIRDNMKIRPDDLGFILESKDGKKIDTGVAIASIYSKKSQTTGNRFKIQKGKQGMFTLVIIYTDTVVPNRKDHVRITQLPLFLGKATKPTPLNSSELEKLQSTYAELSAA